MDICSNCCEGTPTILCVGCKLDYDDLVAFLCVNCSEKEHQAKFTKNHERRSYLDVEMFKHILISKNEYNMTKDELIKHFNHNLLFGGTIKMKQGAFYDRIMHLSGIQQIVSFFGSSAAGKSWLINALLSNNDVYTRPISAEPGILQSTTCDVQGYINTEDQTIYLDVEGLGGTLPIQMFDFDLDSDKNLELYFKRKRMNVGVAYPRFLYIVSDVLCFVHQGSMSNIASIERDLLMFTNIAAVRTYNHLCKPALIIIFNKYCRKDFINKTSVDDATMCYKSQYPAHFNKLAMIFSVIKVIYISELYANPLLTLNQLKMLRETILNESMIIEQKKNELGAGATPPKILVEKMSSVVELLTNNPLEPFDVSTLYPEMEDPDEECREKKIFNCFVRGEILVRCRTKKKYHGFVHTPDEHIYVRRTADDNTDINYSNISDNDFKKMLSEKYEINHIFDLDNLHFDQVIEEKTLSTLHCTWPGGHSS